jgi:integral membrane protein
LLFIAMPLKYWAGFPMAVSVVGMAHGVLFVLFVVSLVEVMVRHRWSFLRSGIIFLSSLIPFGTFLVDYYWLRNAEG